MERIMRILLTAVAILLSLSSVAFAGVFGV